MRRVVSVWALSLVAGCGAGKVIGTSLAAAGVVSEDTGRAIGASDNLTNALKPIGFEEEKAIGGAVALMAVSRFGGLDPDERAQRYVTIVGTAVATWSDRAAIPYHFAVLSSKEPNAFACPGGYVFVTRGLLDSLNDEAELAGVLGHEIAHVSEKHALKLIRKMKLLAGTAEITAAFLDSNPEAFDKIVKETATALFEKGMDADKEADADRIGIDYAHRLGYDANGLRDFLSRLAAKEDAAKTMKNTHPPAAKRVEALNRITKKLYPDPSGPRLANRYKNAIRASAPPAPPAATPQPAAPEATPPPAAPPG